MIPKLSEWLGTLRATRFGADRLVRQLVFGARSRHDDVLSFGDSSFRALNTVADLEKHWMRVILRVMSEAESAREWDDYFLGIARAVAAKSKDPNCKVGAVVVSPDKLVVATGFNGLPRTLGDDSGLLQKKIEKLDWVVHAEHNAVLNAARSGVAIRGCTVHVTKFPCFACLQVLVQAGVTAVCTNDHEFWRNDPCDADHSGKRYIISRSQIVVRAPNHPDYGDRLPSLKGGLRKAGSSEPPRSLQDPANANGHTGASSDREQPPPSTGQDDKSRSAG